MNDLQRYSLLLGRFFREYEGIVKLCLYVLIFILIIFFIIYLVDITFTFKEVAANPTQWCMNKVFRITP